MRKNDSDRRIKVQHNDLAPEIRLEQDCTVWGIFLDILNSIELQRYMYGHPLLIGTFLTEGTARVL